MLDLDPNRAAVAPRPAATTLIVRPASGAVEVLCIVRHPRSTFLGGVLAFPGGKVDAADREPGWASASVGEAHGAGRLGDGLDVRALSVAACREMLEEVGVVPGLTATDAAEVRARMKGGEGFAAALGGRPIDLAALWLFGRWVTPEAEARRYDATFFVAALPAGQEATSDEHETTAVLWETPAGLLARWERGELQMAPPTTRMLELLSGCASLDDVFALAGEQHLGPVCPRFVPDDSGGFLALPGDPAHEVGEARVAGPSRFVLRDGRFVSAQSPSR